MSENRFDGRGFSQDEFGEEERAEMRERNHHYDKHFLDAQEFVKATGLKWATQVPQFIKTFLFAGTLAGAALGIMALLEVFK